MKMSVRISTVTLVKFFSSTKTTFNGRFRRRSIRQHAEPCSQSTTRCSIVRHQQLTMHAQRWGKAAISRIRRDGDKSNGDKDRNIRCLFSAVLRKTITNVDFCSFVAFRSAISKL